jgi:outer membrane protein assembly factor BamB
MYRETDDTPQILVVALGGKVAGIDRNTGDELWRNELPGGGLGIVELLVEEKTVLALAGGKLFCLELTSGEERWSTEVPGSGRGTMLVEDKRIFVACTGELTCVSRTGKRLWTTSLPDMGMGSAAIGRPGNVRQADNVGG